MSSIKYNTVETVIVQLAALDIEHLAIAQQAKLYRLAAAQIGQSPRATLDVIRAFIKRPSSKKVSLKRAATDAMMSRALHNANKMYRTTVR
jgi:hypothetical protein